VEKIAPAHVERSSASLHFDENENAALSLVQVLKSLVSACEMLNARSTPVKVATSAEIISFEHVCV
jgi:hypothetical protein